MKRILTAVLALLLPLLVLSACGAKVEITPAGDIPAEIAATQKPDATPTPEPTATPEPEPRTPKIGLLVPESTRGFSAALSYYARQRGAELGDEIEFEFRTSNTQEEMIEQLEALCAWDADVLIVHPRWGGMEEAVQRAIDSGVVVIALDKDIDAQGVYRITGDHAGVGRTGAAYIVEKIGTTGTVAVFSTGTSGDDLDQRTQGFLDEIAALAPKIQIVRRTTDGTREDSRIEMITQARKDSKIDAVFAANDEMALGVLDAVEEMELENIQLIAGGGGMQEFFSRMAATEMPMLETSLYSPKLGAEAVDYAMDILSGKAVQPERVIPSEAVDAETAEEHLDSGNLFY